MTQHFEESERIKRVFRARESAHKLDARYVLSDPAFALMVEEKERMLKKIFRSRKKTLETSRILDIGCGKGWSLLELWGVGAAGPNLYGVDLLPERISEAKKLLPESHFTVAEAQALPFADHQFEVVSQFTVFSSILDAEARREMACEMLRVMRPGGMILSYDFWINPVNRETVGITPRELRRLFPGCVLTFHRISLAPPLARLLAPVSPLLCRGLSKLKILNTHYLTVIQREKP